MRGLATFDDTGVFRYTLHRRWNRAGRRVCFCLLNPSTADAKVLDPTLKRCLAFARLWNFDAMEVVNIFALRSTDPKQLYKASDPVGPGNDRAIRTAARRADLIIAGWGTHGELQARGAQVANLLADFDLQCLATTKAGHPKHPLYLPGSLTPIPFTTASSPAINA